MCVFFKGGVAVKRLTVVFFFMLPFLLWNVSIVAAQFLEAEVEKLETPVDAPGFTLKELGGRKISLEKLRGRVVLLNFFSPSCSVCQKQASSFDKLDEVIKNKDVVFLTVAVEGREKDLLKYKNKFNISVPILIDENGSVAKAYKVWGHHETFFINRKGKIVGKTFAEKDWTSPSMKNLIHYLLAQK
jgi:peroxiredoxin